jgi:hypothetical protein
LQCKSCDSHGCRFIQHSFNQEIFYTTTVFLVHRQLSEREINLKYVLWTIYVHIVHTNIGKKILITDGAREDSGEYKFQTFL